MNDNTLREKLRFFIEEKLNEATEGTDIEFKVAKDFMKVDEHLVEMKLLDNTFRKVESNFIPAVITEFIGTPENIKDVLFIPYTIPIPFLVPVKIDFNQAKEVLENFAFSLIGNVFELDGFTIATGCTELTNTESVRDINSEEYVTLSITVFATASDRGMVGNKIETYFDEYNGSGVRIYPIGRNMVRTFIEEETQRNDEVETWTLYKESSYSYTLSFVLLKDTPLYETLIEHLEDPQVLNKPWSLKTVYADINKEYNKKVGISSIALDAEVGTVIVMTITIKRIFEGVA